MTPRKETMDHLLSLQSQRKCVLLICSFSFLSALSSLALNKKIYRTSLLYINQHEIPSLKHCTGSNLFLDSIFGIKMALSIESKYSEVCTNSINRFEDESSMEYTTESFLRLHSANMIMQEMTTERLLEILSEEL